MLCNLVGIKVEFRCGEWLRLRYSTAGLAAYQTR
jgi:hypothetical protein